MRLLKASIALGIAFLGLAFFAASAQSVEAEKLERLEDDLSYTDSSTDSLFELAPISIEDRSIGVELFSDPNPSARSEVIDYGLEEADRVRGIEIVEFSLPVN